MYPPVPEPLYDAALRVIARAAEPNDADRLRAWLADRVERLSSRDLSLEVLRHGYECGVEGRGAG